MTDDELCTRIERLFDQGTLTKSEDSFLASIYNRLARKLPLSDDQRQRVRVILDSRE